MEEMKKVAGTCCCLDWNGVLGTNLEQKLQGVYVTMRRMQYITRKMSGQLPDVIVVQPVVQAMFEAVGVSTPPGENDPKHDVTYDYVGKVWGKWKVFVEEDAWMEHHIMMTNLVDNKLSEDPKMWCKISLLNLIMSNNFGYFNMCM